MIRSRSLRPLLAALTLVPLAIAAAPAVGADPAPGAVAAARAAAPALVAQVTTSSEMRVPGEPIAISGSIRRVAAGDTITVGEGVASTFHLQVRTPDGSAGERFGPFTTAPDGTLVATLPASATSGLDTRSTAGRMVAAIDVVDVVTADASASQMRAGTTRVAFADPTTQLVLRNRLSSATGWVKPGDTYTLRLTVENHTSGAESGAAVALVAPPSTVFTDVLTFDGSGTATLTDPSHVTWDVGSIDAATDGAPTIKTLIVQARASTTADDPEVVWKDLSSSATLTYAGGTAETVVAHGPKVIPPAGNFETSQYGDRPYPVVPVRYVDRAPQAANDTADLDRVLNSPDFAGSSFNLYQEMSYGQLYPDGFVPSAGVATAEWGDMDQYTFTTRKNTGTCAGATMADVPGAMGTIVSERITDGWYQLPGDTNYYGQDDPAFSLGLVGAIDSACGQLGKGVFDAATVADPDLDYNDFDQDRDGVVDFFMLLFVGCGGNGASQITTPGTPATNELCAYNPDAPYDNIWPHSSSLEMQYRDAATGLRGYISNDQLRSLTEVPQCYLTERRLTFADCAADGGAGLDTLPTPVRVGPYNVNPETSFDSASVISHEFGHHLGLPDFYSSDSYYGQTNLMAADYSQHMSVFSKQELGWVIPRVLAPSEQVLVEDWTEIKIDTEEIVWQRPDGTPYTLSTANGDHNVHNGFAYTVKMPAREVIAPAVVEAGASAPHVWYSGRGNDFGCPPVSGHNLDIILPELTDVAPGANIELQFASSWDIEWDWDYGFLLTTPDGADYASHASLEGYTTDNAYDPNGQQCFQELNNGITGQSGFYEQGEPFITAARNPAENDYSGGAPFLTDRYDISNLAGTASPAVRFAYFTDAAFDRPGWFIDDVKVLVDGEVVYEEDMEYDGHFDGEHGRIFSGGCDGDGLRSSVSCSDGWSRISAVEGSPADHAYYLELRDRALFDYQGFGQSDRGNLSFAPGLYIEYTDEAHGLGNNGVPAPPAQHYLDATPIPGADCASSNCADLPFTLEYPVFEDDPNDDNGPYVNSMPGQDGDSGDEWWFDYGCMRVEVDTMTGQDLPAAPPADFDFTTVVEPDLTANVLLETFGGCVPYTYGAAAAEAAPQGLNAVAQAKSSAAVGETVTFDASKTTSDHEASTLTYAWDFGDGSAAADGQTASHAYSAAGTYTVTLTVTEPDGTVDSDTLQITITATGGGGTPLPTTGGGLVVFGLLAVTGAAVLRRRTLITG